MIERLSATAEETKSKCATVIISRVAMMSSYDVELVLVVEIWNGWDVFHVVPHSLVSFDQGVQYPR